MVYYYYYFIIIIIIIFTTRLPWSAGPSEGGCKIAKIRVEKDVKGLQVGGGVRNVYQVVETGAEKGTRARLVLQAVCVEAGMLALRRDGIEVRRGKQLRSSSYFVFGSQERHLMWM
eukprot:1189858-Prorocentrum_minimum.AAC.1